MLELIRHVGREFGISIVISTHLMGDVERTCDAVVVLDAGRVLRAEQVAGLTEETETLLVDVVDDAEPLVAARTARPRRRARREPAAAPRTSRATSTTSFATRSSKPARSSTTCARAPHARRRLHAARSSGRQERSPVSTPGAAEIFDLGYQPYEGERRGRWARRRAIWRDVIRISLGLGRARPRRSRPGS